MPNETHEISLKLFEFDICKNQPQHRRNPQKDFTPNDLDLSSNSEVLNYTPVKQINLQDAVSTSNCPNKNHSEYRFYNPIGKNPSEFFGSVSHKSMNILGEDPIEIPSQHAQNSKSRRATHSRYFECSSHFVSNLKGKESMSPLRHNQDLSGAVGDGLLNRFLYRWSFVSTVADLNTPITPACKDVPGRIFDSLMVAEREGFLR